MEVSNFREFMQIGGFSSREVERLLNEIRPLQLNVTTTEALYYRIAQYVKLGNPPPFMEMIIARLPFMMKEAIAAGLVERLKEADKLEAEREAAKAAKTQHFIHVEADKQASMGVIFDPDAGISLYFSTYAYGAGFHLESSEALELAGLLIEAVKAKGKSS